VSWISPSLFCFGIALFQIAIRWARLSPQRRPGGSRVICRKESDGELTENPEPASTIRIKRETANFAQRCRRDDEPWLVTTASPPETGSAALRDYLNMGRKYNNADPARGAGLSAAVEPGA
jgi:hypothetical protein